MSTCEIMPDDDSSDTALIESEDSSKVSDSGSTRKIKSDSISTCEIMPDRDSSDTGSFVVPNSPTQRGSSSDTGEFVLEADSSKPGSSDHRLLRTLADPEQAPVRSVARLRM